MHNNLLSLNLQSQYSINELIFINSGSNYYVRLPVNQSAALFAGNNEGKTSSLSALKLFLLPEVSFKKSESKFNFSSGGTPFSDIASFQYYFPSSESYIICEAENPSFPHGFCWILFKSTDYHYDRIAIPHPYNYIEHLFWNSTSEHNETIGALHEAISIKTIKEKLLSSQYGGQLITDKKLIAEAIYSRTTAQEDHTRFCLLPMVQKSSPDSIRTVRALLDMAFDLSNASTKSLPIAIGSIIDGKGLSVVRDDGVFLDLEDKLVEWENLQKQQTRLSLIKENTPQWLQFKQDTNNYTKKKSDTKDIFNHLSCYIEQAADLFNRESNQLQKQVKKHEQELNKEQLTLREIEDNITGISKLIQDIEPQIKNINDSLNQVETLKNNYQQQNIYSVEEMTQDLKRQIADNNEIITVLQNNLEPENQLTTLTKEINQKQNKINELNASLANIQNKNGFLDQFTEHTSDVLFSLNESFTSLTSIISADEKQIIAQFTHLFTNEDGQLSLNHSPLSGVLFRNYSDKNFFLNLTGKIKSLQLDISNLANKRSSLLQLSKASTQERKYKIEKLIQQNVSIQSKIDNLNGEGNLLKNLDNLQAKLDFNNNEHVTQQEKHLSLKDQVNSLTKQFNISKSAYDNNEKQLTQIQNKRKELNAISLANRGFLDNAVKQPSTTTLLAQVNAYNSLYVEQSINDLNNNIVSINDLKNTIRQSLNIFAEKQLIEMSSEEKHQLSLSSKLFDICYSTLQQTFETLTAQKANFDDRLQAHNNTVATSIRIINNTKEFIDNYINGLNRQLADYQISNLDNVTINTVYHPQYMAAVDAMNKMSHMQDNTFPKELYDHLQSFHASFYLKSSKKINITEIIQKVNYSFSRNNTKEDTPQSNGTNSMVNAILLAILFKSMIPEDLKLKLPVVFDEVGKLDENNLNEIYHIVTGQNLILFVATPDPTGIIASVLDLYHDLSCFQATDVAIHNKAKTIYFKGMEERLIQYEDSSNHDED